MLSINSGPHYMRKSSRRKFDWLVFILFCGVFASKQTGAQNVEAIDEYISRISNSNLSWKASTYYIYPEIHIRSTLDIYKNISESVRLLQQCLTNESKYAIAHVLLTDMLGSFEPSNPITTWNGLEVVLNADGTVIYPETAKSKIVVLWESRIDGNSIEELIEMKEKDELITVVEYTNEMPVVWGYFTNRTIGGGQSESADESR